MRDCTCPLVLVTLVTLVTLDLHSCGPKRRGRCNPSLHLQPHLSNASLSEANHAPWSLVLELPAPGNGRPLADRGVPACRVVVTRRRRREACSLQSRVACLAGATLPAP